MCWMAPKRWRTVALAVILAAGSLAADEHPLLSVLESELKLSMEQLVAADGTRPYFLQYSLTDEEEIAVSASLGAITQNSAERRRLLDVDVRCGDYRLDSTHQIRGDYSGRFEFWGWGAARLPIVDDPLATRHAVWLATDSRFKAAARRLSHVLANLKVKVEEEDPSDDFSREQPSVYVGPPASCSVDRDAIAQRLRACSARFRREPLIYSSSVSFSGSVINRLMVNSEGSRVQSGSSRFRVGIQAATVAEDGMELWQYKSFDAFTLEGLPDDAQIMEAIEQVIAQVLALRAAPLVEPYAGPAILRNRASAVFFHEIFGHRIEGHRQKDVEEGQTFAKKLGQEVLPAFLSVIDDPTLRRFGGYDLLGHYQFDDECVPAQRTVLVENGILRTFLMSRCPTRGILTSNGHGRRQPGFPVCARMGNLIVESTRRVPFAELRTRLIEEVKKQGKEFGLLFEDIAGGFTATERWGPQAFKVIPILVYRVYPDGRPDELVRGVDIVGTPLMCFSKILCTGDDPDVFNGYCGAESGMVPVSGISPSILVEQIEVEKKQKAQDRPPILPAPIASEAR
jgi:TldD protein